MHQEIQKTKETLQNTIGLDNVYLLSEEDKKIIHELEEANNHGVHACIASQVTLVLTHDSRFREPVSIIVKNESNKITFPPVSFPEVKQKNVLSSSPSKEVHDFLVKHFNLRLTEEDATLLIGFEVMNNQ